jgi:hypothetical protein
MLLSASVCAVARSEPKTLLDLSPAMVLEINMNSDNDCV